MEQLSDPGLLKLWLDQRRTYIQQLWDSGFFKFDEGQPTTAPTGNWTATGHLKRADMALGRQRSDLMHSLPQDLVKELVQIQPLFSDKKIASAYKRMVASFVEGNDQSEGSGGPAQTRDLLRFLYSIDVALSRTDNLTKQHPSVQDITTIENQLRVGSQILPMLTALVAQAPEASAVKAAANAKQAQMAYAESMQPKAKSFKERSSSREPRDSRSRQQEQKPGDWQCPECQASNFARRNTCFKCDAPRPAGMPRMVVERRSSAQPAQPGDWACPQCGFSNFQRRTSCFQCNAGRPAGTAPASGLKPGDWECGDCGEVNFARRTECFGCGAPASSAARRQERVSAPRQDFSSRENRTPSPMEMRPGDWLCPECRAHNFATKTECFKCSFPRPASAGPPKPDSRGGGIRGDRGMAPGDWMCPTCNSHNFARRNECFSCGQGRPAETVQSERGPPRGPPEMASGQWWDDASAGNRGRGRQGGSSSQRSDRPRSIPDASSQAPAGRDDFW
ncbi:hypothetical protein WJX84_000581 [Apatococcus fuscideae]